MTALLNDTEKQLGQADQAENEYQRAFKHRIFLSQELFCVERRGELFMHCWLWLQRLVSYAFGAQQPPCLFLNCCLEVRTSY